MAEIDHEDHLFEVHCTACGMHFNPYYNQDGAPLDLGNNAALAKKSSVEPLEEPKDFSESQAAFQEVRDFGEGLARNETPEIQPKPLPKIPTQTTGAGDTLMISGDVLEGYQVDAYLRPISIHADLNVGSDPLSDAFRLLWQTATAKGGNAVVGLRWVLTASETKALVSGTPIRCQKL